MQTGKPFRRWGHTREAVPNRRLPQPLDFEAVWEPPHGQRGPGLGEIIGPAGNLATLPAGAKWVLSLAMMLGRGGSVSRLSQGAD